MNKGRLVLGGSGAAGTGQSTEGLLGHERESGFYSKCPTGLYQSYKESEEVGAWRRGVREEKFTEGTSLPAAQAAARSHGGHAPRNSTEAVRRALLYT